ncbi:Do family serine endopeptidase [Pseudodesulfovibrio cashew]|uniref:Probable periplasmic serine endoprotease DegP-like n=1 Tax=Pseudodesulfovibrio cashew TaxID=2678688 RepID=A0A6I6JHI3_9BACT|nr:Do family serine endopeptidase [Pseudodesulfovibrio cashew]QGY40490.1 Do family serine endopeptidase [Pseudodesulfovibrio cashew]
MIRKTLKFTLVLSLVLFLPVFAQANNLPEFTELAATAGKSVVFISTEKVADVPTQTEQFRQQIPDGHPFKDFFDRFDQFFGQQPGKQPRKQRGQGSGFVISSDGLIVTNNHVIDGADKVTVHFQGDNSEHPAKIIGQDKETDLAVIKIDLDRPLPVLNFGDSDAIKVGEWVLAIGNPYGLDNTVTAGIISAKYRNLRVGPFDNFLQTDASINPGNSGGPLLNMKGEVIGINSLINAAGQNLGFAVPSNQAKEIIAQLKQGKTYQRGWLGVTIQPVDENQAKALGLEEPTGALIASVGEGQPAAKAGVKQGDVVLEVNGIKVHDSNELLRSIANLKPGEKAKLTLWRNGKEITRTVTLGQRGEKAMASMQPVPPKQASNVLGMSVKPISKKEAAALGLGSAHGLLVVQVDPNAAASDEGVRQGDVIVQANQQDVNTPAELEAVIQRDKKRGAVMLLIKRQGQNLFVALPLEDQ